MRAPERRGHKRPCHLANHPLPRLNPADGRPAIMLRSAAITLAWIALAIVPIGARADAESRIALVIGNGAYQHVPRLDNPVNDARLIAATLRKLGFTLVGGQ